MQFCGITKFISFFIFVILKSNYLHFKSLFKDVPLETLNRNPRNPKIASVFRNGYLYVIKILVD